MYESVYQFSEPDIESFTKVLKISGSIETLRFSKRAHSFITMFQRKEICLAVAQNRTLKVLNIQCAHVISNLSEFSKAIAVNAFLGNSLEEIDLEQSCYQIPNFYETTMFPFMNLSEQEIATWREQHDEAKLMEKEQLEKKFYCKIKSINLAKTMWIQ